MDFELSKSIFREANMESEIVRLNTLVDQLTAVVNELRKELRVALGKNLTEEEKLAVMMNKVALPT